MNKTQSIQMDIRSIRKGTRSILRTNGYKLHVCGMSFEEIRKFYHEMADDVILQLIDESNLGVTGNGQ